MAKALTLIPSALRFILIVLRSIPNLATASKQAAGLDNDRVATIDQVGSSGLALWLHLIGKLLPFMPSVLHWIGTLVALHRQAAAFEGQGASLDRLPG